LFLFSKVPEQSIDGFFPSYSNRCLKSLLSPCVARALPEITKKEK
jgi:hypothetical protein